MYRSFFVYLCPNFFIANELNIKRNVVNTNKVQGGVGDNANIESQQDTTE